MALQTKDFSVSGTSVSGGITYTYILRITENSVSIQTNSSNLTVQAILQQSYNGTAFYDRETGVSCTLNGQQIFSDYTRHTLSGNAEHIFYTWTGDVVHDPGGSLTLEVTGKLWQDTYTATAPPAMTVPAGTMLLTPTPRPSAVSAADAGIGAVTAIAIHAHSAEFSHTLRYSFGSLTGCITADGEVSDQSVQLRDPVIYWTVPTAFYSQIPAQKWAYCTVYCTTWYGGEQVGTEQMTTFLATASEAACAPSLTGTVEDINTLTRSLTGDPNRLISRYSIAHCVPSARAKNSAVISHTRVNGTVVTGAYVDLEADTDTFLFVTRDSRGWEAEHTVKKSLIPYEKPVHRAAARRLAPGSEVVEVTVTGRFDPVDFGAAQNSLTLTCQVNSRTPVQVPVEPDSDGNYTVTFQMDGVDYTAVSTLTVTAADLLETVSVKLSVQRGVPVFHWGEGEFTFHVPVTAEQSVAGLYIRHGEGQLRLQTRFTAWEDTGESQSVLVFGSGVLGLLTVGADGSALWDSTQALRFETGDGGILTVQAAGGLTLLSPEPITIV